MLVEHMRRDRARAGTETAVGLLQRDDIGVEFAEHRQHAAGVAAAVEPDALANIVTGDLDHGRIWNRPLIHSCCAEIGRATSELQSLLRISYAVLYLNNIKKQEDNH